MAYTINRTDGSLFATVADGTIDATSSLVIIGKNYAGYGEALNENFVRLLESHANDTQPSNPQTGQLWFDKTNSLLNVYNGTKFAPLAAQSSQSTEPTSNITGDLWFDTVNSQLHVYDGTQYVLVGPSYSSGAGTSGAIVDTIEDTLATDHVVIKLFVSNELVAIISKDATFTPASAISGFAATIDPGIQLAQTVGGEVPIFTGTATNSALLDSLDSTQFLRSDDNDTTTGTINIANDGGLEIGIDDDAKISVVGDDVYIENQTADGDLVLATHTLGSPQTAVITIDGLSGKARVGTPSNSLDIANKDYVDTAVGSADDPTKLPLAGGTLTGQLYVDYSGAQITLQGAAAGFSTLRFFDGTNARGQLQYNDADGSMTLRRLNSSGVLQTELILSNDGNVSVNAALPTNAAHLARKDYVDGLISTRPTMVGVDNPTEYAVTMQTNVTFGWQTHNTLPANTKFAMVVGETYSIASNANQGSQSLYVRKKGLTGNAASKWRFTYGGGGADTSTGEFTTGSGSQIVECDANGDFEYYGYTSGGTAPTGTIKVVAYWTD